MICHSLIDMIYVITPSSSYLNDVIFSIILIVIGMSYGMYLMKNNDYDNI
jgi:uncharacterized membrane protein